MLTPSLLFSHSLLIATHLTSTFALAFHNSLITTTTIITITPTIHIPIKATLPQLLNFAFRASLALVLIATTVYRQTVRRGPIRSTNNMVVVIQPPTKPQHHSPIPLQLTTIPAAVATPRSLLPHQHQKWLRPYQGLKIAKL